MASHEKVRDDFPTKYLTFEDIEGLTEEQRTVTIERCEWEQVTDLERVKKDPKATKPMRVVYFKGAKKGLGLCKSLAYSIAFELGEMTYAKWVGRQITLIVRETHAFGSRTKCVRAKVSKRAFFKAKVKCANHPPYIIGDDGEDWW